MSRASTLPTGMKLPALLQLLHWVYRPIRFMEHCERAYGDWFTLRLPFRQVFFLTSNPEAIQQIFSGEPKDLHAGKANIVLKPLLGSRSLLLLDGEEHLRERRLLMPPFHGDRVHSYRRTIEQVTDKTVQEWGQGQTFPVHPQMQSITLEAILRVVLGVKQDKQLGRLKSLITRLLAVSSSPFMLLLGGLIGERMRQWPSWMRPPSYNRFLKLLGQTDQVLYEEIQKHRSPISDGEVDVLSFLTGATDEEGAYLSDRDLRDEMMTLLVAGHETTATALSWIVWRLVRHPEVQERLAAELEKSSTDGQSLEQSRYLDAVIKETLRLNPVIPLVGRLLQKPMRLGSRELPAGVVVAPCVYLTHRRADLWAHPERFNPDRFLEGRPRPFEFLPFGGGARYCLGAAFALYEMKVVLSRILPRFRLQAVPGYQARVSRRGVTLAPSQGVPIQVFARVNISRT